MLKKFMFTIVIVVMMCTHIFAAESTDIAELVKRIEALEERVASLEAQIQTTPQGTDAAPAQEVIEQSDVETGMTANNCTLSFKKAELGKTYKGEDAVILYFDFTNGSGKTTCAGYEFYVKVFQNNREQESASIEDNQAFNDKYVEFRSGADTVEVAFASKITDTSDIIVNISSMSDWSVDDVEFSVTLE